VDPERFLKRRMGSYVLKGRKQALVVYEILGYADKAEMAIRKRSASYLDIYQNAPEAFERGDLDTAVPLLTACAAQHDRLPADPAAGLMLKAIAKAKDQPGPWPGSIVLDSK
jgi:hypothetical protein